MVSTKGAPARPYFVALFQYVATQDISSYLCVQEALKFRQDICGGEGRIMNYCIEMANEGGKRSAEILGTEVMQNAETTLTKCSMVNVKLPLTIGNGEYEIPERDALRASVWIVTKLVEERDIYAPCFVHAG